MASVNSTVSPPGRICRAIHLFAVFDAYEHVGCTAVRGNAHDAFVGLAEYDPVRAPTHAKRLVCRRQIVTAAPPPTATLLSVWSALDQKATDRLSGENTGLVTKPPCRLLRSGEPRAPTSTGGRAVRFAR